MSECVIVCVCILTSSCPSCTCRPINDLLRKREGEREGGRKKEGEGKKGEREREREREREEGRERERERKKVSLHSNNYMYYLTLFYHH